MSRAPSTPLLSPASNPPPSRRLMITNAGSLVRDPVHQSRSPDSRFLGPPPQTARHDTTLLMATATEMATTDSFSVIADSSGRPLKTAPCPTLAYSDTRPLTRCSTPRQLQMAKESDLPK
ncbi:hypothetical protein D9619_012999 [Psilocybe cf. subviscida]|uniref:Uncharacterized protein n=1 Tax=Psilocybe cf. subviscida TaxID=2480587 RepID=A0A8H5B069_9AGAR|nr:hypothetical protein D9619_012999 [Psilocybe cf. subviscida]